MPVTDSARKALRNSEAKRAHNVEIKAELKRVLKNASIENLSAVVSFVDKAAKREIIHPNKAARIKSALSKLTTEVSSSRAKKAASKSSGKTQSTKAKLATKKSAIAAKTKK